MENENYIILLEKLVDLMQTAHDMVKLEKEIGEVKRLNGLVLCLSDIMKIFKLNSPGALSNLHGGLKFLLVEAQKKETAILANASKISTVVQVSKTRH
jgi:hypothetical protein